MPVAIHSLSNDCKEDKLIRKLTIVDPSLNDTFLDLVSTFVALRLSLRFISAD